jgi:hypothetical protein
VPTFVFLDANGQERPELRQVGIVPADEFVKLMDKALAAPQPGAQIRPAICTILCFDLEMMVPRNSGSRWHKDGFTVMHE